MYETKIKTRVKPVSYHNAYYQSGEYFYFWLIFMQNMQWRIWDTSQRKSANPDLGMATYYLAKFFYQKLHEKKINWTEMGAQRLGSANYMLKSFDVVTCNFAIHYGKLLLLHEKWDKCQHAPGKYYVKTCFCKQRTIPNNFIDLDRRKPCIEAKLMP